MVHKLHNKFNIIVNSTQSQLIYNDKQTCKSNVVFFAIKCK